MMMQLPKQQARQSVCLQQMLMIVLVLPLTHRQLASAATFVSSPLSSSLIARSLSEQAGCSQMMQVSTKLCYSSSSSSEPNNSFSDKDVWRQYRQQQPKAPPNAIQPHLTVQELERARAEFEHLWGQSTLPHPQPQLATMDHVQPAGVIYAQPPRQTHDHDHVKAGSHDDNNSIDENDDDDEVVVLTSARRQLLEMEVQLLWKLLPDSNGIGNHHHHHEPTGSSSSSGSNSCAVEDALVQLWTTERCDAAASHALLRLQQSEYCCSAGLVVEEEALIAVCRSNPHWAEPWSRLATVLCYKPGRWADALAAAEEAARIKPWHFEALNACRLILAQLPPSPSVSTTTTSADTTAEAVNELETLRRRCQRLARRALPPLDARDGHCARRVWVEWAVAQAQRQLQRGVQQQQQQYHHSATPCTSTAVVSDQGSWQ